MRDGGRRDDVRKERGRVPRKAASGDQVAVVPEDRRFRVAEGVEIGADLAITSRASSLE
jgi:hypothetical protein